MDIEGTRILVLGGGGLVGTAVCRALLNKRPREIMIHSRRQEKAEEARENLLTESGSTVLSVTAGDIFALGDEHSQRELLQAQLQDLKQADLQRFRLYRLLQESKPQIVIDCVNTATGIAYNNIFQAAVAVHEELESESISSETVKDLLESLSMPRLIRHIQVLYQGMIGAGTGVYVKVGTTGTGGMGLDMPYTHSEERPSRLLLAKSAVAGAHSMLLFLMARTPGAPITKEIKPAAAIAWKRIAHGPIHRQGISIHLVDATPQPIGNTFSTFDQRAAKERDEILDTAYIDLGENGIYSLEEFAALTTVGQMEFLTPEEVAQYVLFEIEGRNTGHDIINAIDGAVLGPSYRGGRMRHWALDRMRSLEIEAGTSSVAFENLGPPRLTKLLFEAHLLRLAFGTLQAVRTCAPKAVAQKLKELVLSQPEVANQVVAVGTPILLPSGEIVRGPRVLVPSDASEEPVTAERLEAWVHDGWVDLREQNCSTWIERFNKIQQEVNYVPEEDTSSHYLRQRAFWDEDAGIQPGKLVGWIFSQEEEQGKRLKR